MFHFSPDIPWEQPINGTSGKGASSAKMLPPLSFLSLVQILGRFSRHLGET